jgi:hypothetical protein
LGEKMNEICKKKMSGIWRGKWVKFEEKIEEICKEKMGKN